MSYDERLRLMREGHARKYAWSAETIATIKRMLSEGHDVQAISVAVGINRKTLRNRAPSLRIDLGAERHSRQRAGDAVLFKHYASALDVDDVFHLWCAAIKEQKTLVAMRFRAARLGLKRDAEAKKSKLVRANRARTRHAQAKRAAKLAEAQKQVAAGATPKQIMSTVRISRDTLREFVKAGLLTFPPKAVVTRPPKPPKVAKVKAPKVKREPPPVVRPDPPAPVVFEAPSIPPALPEPDPRTGRIYAPFATIRALAAYHGFIYDGSNMDRVNRVRAAMNRPLLVQDDACGWRP